MDTKEILTKEKDWMLPLYSIVVERISKLCKRYSIKSEYEELVKITFYRMINLIYDNESYYFIPNGKSVKSTSFVKHLLDYKDLEYCLDKKKVLSKMNEMFVYPLVKECEYEKELKKVTNNTTLKRKTERVNLYVDAYIKHYRKYGTTKKFTYDELTKHTKISKPTWSRTIGKKAKGRNVFYGLVYLACQNKMKEKNFSNFTEEYKNAIIDLATYVNGY